MSSCEDFSWYRGFAMASGIVSRPTSHDKTQWCVPQVPSLRDILSSSGSSPSCLGRYSQKSLTDVHNHTRRMREKFLWACGPPLILSPPIHEPHDIIIEELIIFRWLLCGFQMGERQHKSFAIWHTFYFDRKTIVWVIGILKAQECI